SESGERERSKAPKHAANRGAPRAGRVPSAGGVGGSSNRLLKNAQAAQRSRWAFFSSLRGPSSSLLTFAPLELGAQDREEMPLGKAHEANARPRLRHIDHVVIAQ